MKREDAPEDLRVIQQCVISMLLVSKIVDKFVLQNLEENLSQNTIKMGLAWIELKRQVQIAERDARQYVVKHHPQFTRDGEAREEAYDMLKDAVDKASKMDSEP
jgi:hypothetical protein